MSLAANRKRIEKLLDEYRQRLDLYPEDDFTDTPAEGVWSYAEVYAHILNATYQSLLAAERCLGQNAQFHKSGTPLVVKLILAIGRIPPGKHAVPAVLADKTAKISREDARNLLIRVRKKLDDVYPKLRGYDPLMRVKHPRLGMLHAAQWLRFTWIHLRHHVAQLNRISKMRGRARS
ncbi:MAG: DinB family protein [Mucilaginibacter polytrichastri]|nr:DinB family protein [Mucilaginibacter polytrichastri]